MKRMLLKIEAVLVREFLAKQLKSGANFLMTTLTKTRTLTYSHDAQLGINTKFSLCTELLLINKWVEMFLGIVLEKFQGREVLGGGMSGYRMSRNGIREIWSPNF